LTGTEFNHVSWELEGDDLAATIVGELVTSRRAGLDLVKIFSKLTFALDFAVSPEANWPTRRSERLSQRILMVDDLLKKGVMQPAVLFVERPS
jgi:hypothetical protein